MVNGKFSFTCRRSRQQNQKYQLENPVQFGRRAAKRRGGKFDFSLLAPYTEDSSNTFRHLRRRGESPVIATRPPAGSPRSSKTAKEPEKYQLEPHFVKENFSYIGHWCRNFFEISVFVCYGFFFVWHLTRIWFRYIM